MGKGKEWNYVSSWWRGIVLMYGSFILCVKVLCYVGKFYLYVGKFYLMCESFILCVEGERVELC